MMTDDHQLAVWRDSLAALLELPIACGDPAEIIANLRIIAAQMALVSEVALDPDAEPAPVFRP